MGQLCENPFSLKHMKRRLLDYFGKRVIITEMKGKPNIITLRSTASNILQKFYSLPKPEDPEQQKLRVIETAAKLIQTDIKTVETRKDIYPSAEDISTPEKCLAYLPESLKILLMKRFVGKNTQLKQAAVGHAIMQAVRPRAVIAPLQICLGVQLHLEFGSRFLIETLHELGFCSSYQEVQKYQQSAAVSQPLEIPGLIQGQFLQFVADNIDHNTQTLDGLNTFHGMGMISAVTPGIKCTSRRIPRVTVTAEDVAAVAKVDIHFYKNVERFNIKYEKLPDISIDDNSRNTDILWKLSWLLCPITPAWNGTMQLVHHGEYPGPSLINFLPMIDMDPTNESCIYSTLHFVADQAKIYGVTPVLTFDQPLWMKAQRIIDAEPSASRIKNIVLRQGGFHMEISFLGSIGHIMTETGLKDLFSVVYAENTVPHMLSGKAIARAIRAHTLVELALHALIAADIFEINRPDNNAVDVNDEDSIDQANARHNRDERSDAIITLDINEQAAHVHANTVAEEAMKLFDNLMKHEVDLADVESDENVKIIVQLLETKLEDISKKNRTSKLWIQYIKMLGILRKFVKAERTGNWMLHLQTVRDMLPYFAATGHNAYTKSGHIYLSRMANLKHSDSHVHTHFMKGYHSIRRSDRYWSGLSSDLVIEQVLMRSIKTVGGLTRGRGMSESQQALWILSRPACSEINSTMQELIGNMYTSSDQHKDYSESHKKRDQKDVKSIIDYLEERSPFSDGGDLRSIASGVVSDKTANVDEARNVGQKIVDRMAGQHIADFTFKKKDQVVLMSDSSSVKVDEKEITIDPQLLFQRLISVAKGYVQVDDLDTFFSYELCTYPPSIFESAHLLRDAKKSVFAAEIQKAAKVDCNFTPKENKIKYVLDGGSLLARLPWPRGTTYETLCDMYVNYVTVKYGECVVVFDGYGDGPSTKDNVHRRRTGGMIGTEVKVEGQLIMNTKKEKFLANSKNKQKFIDLLSSKLKATGVRTEHAKADADLLIVKTAIDAAANEDTILVGEDTDLLVLLCYYAKDLPSKLYLRPEPKAQTKRAKTWDICATRKGLGDAVCNNILFLHATLGCDTTSKLYGIGKGASLKVYKNDPVFRKCAAVFDIDPEMLSQEEIIAAGEMAIMCLHNFKQHSVGINVLRKMTFLDKVANGTICVNPQSLPPTHSACKYHSLRVYFQILEWKSKSESVNVEEYGWMLRKGVLEPVKTDQDPAPKNILTMIRCGCKSGCKTSQCTCRKLGLECSLVCKNCRGSCTNSQQPDLQLNE